MKQLLDTTAETGLDPLKTVPKKVVHKAAEATGNFTGNKIADKIDKPKLVSGKKSIDAEEIIIPPEKREEILNELRQVLQKWNTTKLIKRFNCVKVCDIKINLCKWFIRRLKFCQQEYKV